MGRRNPSGHSSQWESPTGAADGWLHVLGTAWAPSLVGECHSTCQRLGALSLRGSQTRLPCTHQRGNLCAPPQAAPSQLETLQAALASGVGQVGVGPPMHTPKKPGTSASRLPCLTKKHLFCFAYILLEQKMRRNNHPCRGTMGKLLGNALLHWSRLPKEQLNIILPNSKTGAELRVSPLPQTCTRSTHTGLLTLQLNPALLFSLLTSSTGGTTYCGGDFVCQTQVPLRTPISKQRELQGPASAPLLLHFTRGL